MALKRNRTIRSVVLDRRFTSNLSTEEYHAILYAIGCMPGLMELEIWNATVPLALLCDALKHGRQLRRLGLGSVRLTDYYGDCSALTHLHHLWQVCLYGFRLDEALPATQHESQDLQAGLTSITGTIASTSDTGARPLDSFLAALAQCRCLDKIEIVSSPQVNDAVGAVGGLLDPDQSDPDHLDHPWSSHGLAWLILGEDPNNDHVGDDANCQRHLSRLRMRHEFDRQTTADAATNDMMSSLHATHCNDTRRGDPFGQSRELRHLTLRRLGIVPELLEPVCAALESRRLCHRQEVEGKLSLNATINVLENLRVLDLNENHLGRDDGFTLCRLLSALNPAGPHGAESAELQELLLRSNQLTDVACSLLVPVLMVHANFSLEKISLASNPLRDTGARHLAHFLQSNPFALKHLELVRTDMTDTGCEMILEALTSNTTLRTLDLSYNQMTTSTYSAAAQALRVNQSLRSLSLQMDHASAITQGSYQAMIDTLEHHNFTLQILHTGRGYVATSSDINILSRRIKMFLNLNHAGRHNLLRGRIEVTGTTTRLLTDDWIQAFHSLSMTDTRALDAIYYLLRSNPSLCQRP